MVPSVKIGTGASVKICKSGPEHLLRWVRLIVSFSLLLQKNFWTKSVISCCHGVADSGLVLLVSGGVLV